MELRQLRSMLAVAEERQFALAARRLYLSPAALTTHIAALERELGVILFDRHPVAPTPAGAGSFGGYGFVGDVVRLQPVGIQRHGVAVCLLHVQPLVADLEGEKHVAAGAKHSVELAQRHR
jgi:Bacterial regulatory helix-turn-helix protein, lysR family